MTTHSAKKAVVKKNRASIYAILARDAQKAAVLRRGPSRQVLLLAWDTAKDEFKEGQWLKGRIYELRCGLSPSGDKFIYFAANHKPPYGTWTAVSRPPYFTAIALWPKGDTWGGGGAFLDESTILLNNGSNQMEQAEGFSLPKGVKIKPYDLPEFWDKEDPRRFEKIVREGWKVYKGPKPAYGNPYKRLSFAEYDPPYMMTKKCPAPHSGYLLRESLYGIKEKDGPWHALAYDLMKRAEGTNTPPEQVFNLGRTDWADWDKNGDLLYAKDGCIYRLKPDKNGKLAELKDAALLIDLNGLTFTNRISPPEARSWE